MALRAGPCPGPRRGPGQRKRSPRPRAALLDPSSPLQACSSLHSTGVWSLRLRLAASWGLREKEGGE